MKVEVITSGIEGCPSCKRSVELVKSVLREFSDTEFGEINALEEIDRIQDLGFVSAGAVVIDGKVEFSSTPKEKALRKKLEKLRIRI
ncbi:thioredoxin family protein [Cytobacillus firmus]|uniref:Thioredoxin family protein n=1 Tax=Cytobacillus firmus TaxID=1399 RepID=A0AA46PVW0_CYTFI|nr:thioredoxin family protein [Cytobacillus firmus]UYG98172.1 thioredoxin family protein [Cytobacillus firmus]